MFLLRALLVAQSTGLLASCAVGPEYHRPDSPLPDHYHGQSAVQQRSTAQPANFPVWWDSLRDPLFNHFVSTCLAQNLDLAQASAQSSDRQSRQGHPALKMEIAI